jgi:hypothetical protein
MIGAAYGIDWANTEFVDLKLVEDKPMVAANGIYSIPKLISTGEKKGQPTWIRRENLNVCPLIVVNVEAAIISEKVEEDVQGSANKAPDMFESAPKDLDAEEDQDWVKGLGAEAPDPAAEQESADMINSEG